MQGIELSCKLIAASTPHAPHAPIEESQTHADEHSLMLNRVHIYTSTNKSFKDFEDNV